LLRLEYVYNYGAHLINWVEYFGVFAKLLTVILYVLVVAFSIPGASLLTTLLGFLFGVLVGGLLAVVGATLGVITLFWVLRWGFGKNSIGKLVESKFFQHAEYGISRNLYKYLLFIRLFPIIPFWVANLAPPVLGVSFKAFMLTTIIGITPGTFVISFIGSKLRMLFDSGTDWNSTVHYNSSFSLFFVFLSILVISPILYKVLKGIFT
jgi:uncharacterized membrane protein YdjX (TVP38/TMEM64 family)